MNLLSSINNPVNSNTLSDAYGVNREQSNVTNAENIAVNSGKQTLAATELTKSDNTLVLSGRAERAQKIEAMANDFFKGGQFTSAQLPSLIQRLYQDGILSEGQLNRLSNSGFELPPADEQSLSDFIDEQAAALTDSEEDSSLAQMLDDAKWVMGAMDFSQSPLVAQKANRVSSQITELLNSEKSLSEAQVEQYKGLKALMQLTSMTGEHQQENGQLNSYLALANKH
ncbi:MULTISPECIES: hypothetical protein [unclassified Shewanella]|uniref:hypothetical protein n=1 Tax=unclassified Shewanella TaxID=196818 RepID=UPI001BC66370|nr:MULTISPECIES: hypothetical protein [unclassified Shewanella]GIU08352.1 hypothetical protein TUM4444_09230 [Shewanella sp. MBTL60-112-B1]GIU35257.1 hypothetical protein TUM4445_24870 [Shewanella sp. MBTL60-112-B2]